MERLDLQKSSPKIKKNEPTQVSMQASEQQDDLDMTKKVPTGSTSSDIGEQLTYSQEYYILHREELMAKRK